MNIYDEDTMRLFRGSRVTRCHLAHTGMNESVGAGVVRIDAALCKFGRGVTRRQQFLSTRRERVVLPRHFGAYSARAIVQHCNSILVFSEWVC